MADMSKLNENLDTLAQKVDSLIAKASSQPAAADQEEIDTLNNKVMEILARIP